MYCNLDCVSVTYAESSRRKVISLAFVCLSAWYLKNRCS